MTIANMVTLLRLALVPVIWLLAAAGQDVSAAAVFVLAAGSDAVDGWLARRLGQVSDIGKLLDPLADKVLTLSVLYLVTTSGFAPTWLVIVLLVKEAALVGGGGVLLRKGRVVSARLLGKLATVLLFISLAGGLAGIMLLRPLLYLGAVLSVAAGIDYLLTAVSSSSNNSV